MKTKIPVLLAALFFLTVLSGCAAENPDRPPSIRYGKDVCGECRMIISEEQFASAITEKGTDPVRFDSVGCMLKYLSGHDASGKRIWVHDFDTRQWIDAKDSHFVRNQEIPTPMGDGFIAFQSSAAAQVESGTVFKFNDLLKKEELP